MVSGVELEKCGTGHEMSNQQSEKPGLPQHKPESPKTGGYLQLRSFTVSGLLNSPKTKMINGIMLVVFPYPFAQVSLWRCNLETTDRIVVPGAWVPNPPNADGCTPVAFWGLGFGKVKAQAKASTSLGWGPLKLGRLIANGSQAVPRFEPHDSFTKSYS